MNLPISRKHLPLWTPVHISVQISARTYVRAVLLILLSFGAQAKLRAQGTAGGGAPAAPAAPVVAAPPVQITPTVTAPAQNGVSATGTNTAQTNAQTNRTTEPIDTRAQSPSYRDALTQFQQLVSNSTGSALPIFGASLFNGVPSTFAPVSDIPVSPGYVLGPGDSVSIQLTGQVQQQYNLTVDSRGAINVPNLGPVQVAGVTYGHLPAYLNSQFGRIYRNFNLSATLGALRTIQVFVVGEARRPGAYSISSLSTLLNAVFASGGPLPTGSLRDIQVRREGKTLVHFDLYDLLLHGDKTNDIQLASGDVIFIPVVGPQVALVGSVTDPAIYELSGPTTITNAIQLAGGQTATASAGGVRLERVYEHRDRSVQDVGTALAASVLLQNGDIVSVSSIVERFRNAVTLRGNVASPGRYVWHQGMRLSDLFPNKESLITRNYWTKRNQLGMFMDDYVPGTTQSTRTGQGALQVNGTDQQRQVDQAQSSNSPTTQGINGQNTNGANGNNGNNSTNSSSTGATGAAGNNANTRESFSTGAGTTVSSALASNNSNFTPNTDIILSAPDIDWSYAVIERLSTVDLKTSLIPFNLGKLILDGDSSQNFELQPGDVITIFSTADIRVPSNQQTRFVRLEGEFVAPGVYSVLPGETLRSLLLRAGGFTPEAYLYASAFTRESVRRVQTQRLREYADQLDAQISSVTANNTARAISASDQVAAGASEADARQAVQRLRQVQPTGRIVLDLKPNSRDMAAVPDLSLEDGDRFVVPRLPSDVTVEGQVYNANAFVYIPSRRTEEYLHRAGGPDREADKKRIFVLRSDGSVVSEQYTNVKKATIFPGDTVVVPPILDRRGLFQRFVDLTSIVTNFGYSAATLYLISR